MKLQQSAVSFEHFTYGFLFCIGRFYHRQAEMASWLAYQVDSGLDWSWASGEEHAFVDRIGFQMKGSGFFQVAFFKCVYHSEHIVADNVAGYGNNAYAASQKNWQGECIVTAIDHEAI